MSDSLFLQSEADLAEQRYRSFTETLKSYLNEPVTTTIQSRVPVQLSESVYELAAAAGLTVEEYVISDVGKAIREAEASVAEWLKIQSMAAIEGQIKTNDGEFPINRNTTALIKERVQQAKETLEKVYEYSYMAGGLSHQELVTRVLVKKATKGDMRAIEYMGNRTDGRPGETMEVDTEYDNAFNVYQIIHTLFDKQLEVLNSGTGTKLICCTRRAGKTHLIVASCAIEALRTPNTTCIILGETMENEEALVETAWNKIVDKCKLRDRRGKRLNWRHLDNGSRIIVCGLSNTKDPDKLLGFGAKVIAIDEFFALKDKLLDYLVKEVLRPMQMDYPNDYKFICAGTPPRTKGSYGEMAWRKWEVPHYFWTYKDNPYPADPAEKERYVNEELAELGLDMTSIYARREYGGEWIYDEDIQLYPTYHVYDPKDVIPQFHIDQILVGIDYGVSDNDVVLGIAWDNEARRGYVWHEDKFNRLDIKDHSISQLDYLKSRVLYVWERALQFFPNMEPKEANKRILWDADDNDQKVTDDFNINLRLKLFPELRLNIRNAHKTDTVFMQDKIKEVLTTGALLLIKDGIMCNECDRTVLTRGPGGQIYPTIDNKVYHPDALQAARYALYNVLGEESPKKHGA